MTNPEVEIVLCIPGPWDSQTDLVKRVVKDSGGYIFAGRVLQKLESEEFFELQLEYPDERMFSAFQAAGPHWKGTPEMELIATHKSVAYLISNGGSLEAAHSIMEAANGLLKAGGFGVKVESTGIAHSPQAWAEQCKYNYLFKSHSSYVVYITDIEYTYSCGMHNFGLPDAITRTSESENSADLLRDFTHYLLSESPQIESGQTFSADADSPVYRIYQSPCIDYGEESLFNNPYGTWGLEIVK